MDERAAERPEAEVAMTSSIPDLTYFRRQVNESLMKLQRSLLRGERQDGGGHVIQQSPPSASAACDFHVSIMLIASCCINGSERPYRNVRPLADNIDVDRGPARTCSVKKTVPSRIRVHSYNEWFLGPSYTSPRSKRSANVSVIDECSLSFNFMLPSEKKILNDQFKK